jgi:hypothetical protein
MPVQAFQGHEKQAFVASSPRLMGLTYVNPAFVVQPSFFLPGAPQYDAIAVAVAALRKKPRRRAG